MANISGALFYLRVTSLRNAVIARVSRLKQPKYLIGAVVGLAYIYFAFFRRMLMSRNASTLPGSFPQDLLPVATVIGAAIVLLLFALCWVWPRERASLNFSEAEIAFLFPAPLTRKSLIHYRLLSSQGRILFTALIIAFFSSGWSFLQGNALIRILGWWIIAATLSLHILGSAFVITHLLDRGVTASKRMLLTMSAIVVLGIAIGFWIWHNVPAPSPDALSTVRGLAGYLGEVFASGPLAWLLLPTQLLVRPLLAPNFTAFLIALGPALAIYAFHYIWVLYAEVDFEEASIAKAEKRAARVAAMREGKVRIGNSAQKARRAPFDLAAVKRPEFAFLWKNLLSTAEYLRPRTAIIAALIIVTGCTWLKRDANLQSVQFGIGMFATIVGGYLLILGPQLARQDLRNDLMNADILKTYPLPGWQIVLGELLTPVAIISVLLWLVLLTAAVAFPASQFRYLTPPFRAAAALSLGLIAPLLCTLQLLVANAAVVLFPAWSQSSRRAGGGIDVMGQRLFFMAGQLFVIIVALIPAAIAAGTVYWSAQWIIGLPLAVALAVVIVVGVLIAEVALGLRWLGLQFDKFDLSAELRS